MVRVLLLVCVVSLWGAAPVFGQQEISCAPAAGAPGSGVAAESASVVDAFRARFDASGGQIQFLPKADGTGIAGLRLTQLVELPVPCQIGTRISADQIDIIFEGSQLVATGNVVFANPTGQIAAERIEFNMADGTGVFFTAFGILALPNADRTQFANQDPEVYFYGDKVEKLSAAKYRITRGGFSTCVQPTPRWEVTSKSIILNVDEYAVARNTILRVKGVPLFYIPLLYYPIRNDERSTGFLMPTYGTSTLRGASISNGFFWAINRSQDATFFHDWMRRAGQGMGAEYRYIANASSSGDVRFYRFNQRPGESLAGETSYEVRGSLIHAISPSVRVSARADYASSVLTQQLYQQTVFRATVPVRVIEGGVSGTWGPLSTRALYQRNEIFSTSSASTVYGSTPGLTAAIAPTRLFGSPIYGSVNTEFSHLPNQSVSNGIVSSDLSLRRFDLAPTIRAPLSRLSFLTVNTTAAYRRTYYSRSAASLEPATRGYFSTRAEIIGPVMSKIWDTPDSTSTDRKKHVIEPFSSLDYVTNIADPMRFPSTYSGGYEVIIGGSTRFTYGLTNRLLYRSRAVGAVPGTSREFLTIGVQQTYYSTPDASRWDSQYATALYRELGAFSPIVATARVSPSSTVNMNTKVEYDLANPGFPSISVGGGVSTATNTSNVSYSRVIYTPTFSTNYISASSSVNVMQGRTTVSYSLNWDLARAYIVSQSANATYLAQCCGVKFEYQQFNFPPGLIGFPVTADQRFNFSVVLAGLGTLSNFFGAFGGQP